MAKDDPIDAATRQELEGLMNEFARRVDNGLGDSVHELFTENGAITGPGLAMKNRAEIAEQFALRARDTRRVSRHLWSNPRFERLNEHTVRVTTTVQTYIHTLAEDEALPAAGYLLVVGDSTDVMERGDDGRWRFASRELDVVFRTEVD